METEQQIRLNFLDEVEEYFDRMESYLLGLADAEIDPQKVDFVLRAAHSIKGGAAMMGFQTLSKVAHRLEDFLKILRVRHASIAITAEIETLFLQSVDLLRSISDLNRQGLEVTEEDVSNRTQPIFDRLQEYLGDLKQADEDALLSQDEDVDPALLLFEEGVDTVLDRFETQLQELGIDELAEELATTAEELIGFGYMANLESFIELCKSVQKQAEDLSSQSVTPLANEALKVWRRSHALVLRGSLEKLPSSLKSDLSLNVNDKTKAIFAPSPESSLDLDGLQSAFEVETESEAVDFDPLLEISLDLGGLQSAFEVEGESQKAGFDSLEMDRYSDVHLICQEQIETIVQLQEVATDIELGVQEINQAVRNLNYTTKSMQGNVTRTQMLPFAEVVKRFPRVVRDLNLQYNKQVTLKIIGENTLLDRSVVEALSDPLMHLFRNSFDHGIEDTETRIAAGKSPSGTITIRASNQGTYTVITISDDGGGIPLDKIRDRVIQMGMSRSEVAQIPETDLLDFIFEPGFSTARQVTELSGRGVGMDVVRTNLREMRGDVKVATQQGEGTTFTLKIPFTLSILKVAIIEQADLLLAIPATSIRELVPLNPQAIVVSEKQKNLVWNDSEIPLVEAEKILIRPRTHNTIELAGEPAIDKPMALVVGNEESHAALQISRFWHEQESTIRPIDSPIPLPPGVISSVIFGNGNVIPLFDPLLLVEKCLENQLHKEQLDFAPIESTKVSTVKTVLVVDDSINVRRYLSLTLEKAGYRVEQAKDGQEAVDKLLSGLMVQAVICDIEMPRLDGYGVLEELKERSQFKNLPIAMLTSRSNEKHRKLAMNLGASAYFSKPYNEQELLQTVKELMENSNL